MKSNRVSTRGILVTLCADESRVGMPGRAAPQGKLTGIGVKPIGEVQWQLLYRWLYGVVELLSGEHFMLEMSHLLRRFYKRSRRRIPISCTGSK